MPDALSDLQIESALEQLPHWEREGDMLVRRLEFSDFRAAVSFIVRMAFYADEHDHHPELRNVYNRVELRLTTHDAGDRITTATCGWRAPSSASCGSRRKCEGVDVWKYERPHLHTSKPPYL